VTRRGSERIPSLEEENAEISVERQHSETRWVIRPILRHTRSTNVRTIEGMDGREECVIPWQFFGSNEHIESPTRTKFDRNPKESFWQFGNCRMGIVRNPLFVPERVQRVPRHESIQSRFVTLINQWIKSDAYRKLDVLH
jgi:hypothetical protein